ncbi:hypothetical protein THUN1379_24170 [Paludibacterium sp. THUN1379]|nr:hypothetical protein THUN1379_24170 [Paludibacterium sp. THUN1379]
MVKTSATGAARFCRLQHGQSGGGIAAVERQLARLRRIRALVGSPGNQRKDATAQGKQCQGFFNIPTPETDSF